MSKTGAIGGRPVVAGGGDGGLAGTGIPIIGAKPGTPINKLYECAYFF